MTAEFGDHMAPLLTEPVIGVRVFRVSPGIESRRARLMPVTYAYEDGWVDGENTAVCRAYAVRQPPEPTPDSRYRIRVQRVPMLEEAVVQVGLYGMKPLFEIRLPEDVSQLDPDLIEDAVRGGLSRHYQREVDAWQAECKRREAIWDNHTMADCEHGFWAHYTRSDTYMIPGSVHAVIEGYGEVLIGTKGFRASKARILAVSLEPFQLWGPVSEAVEQLKADYPSVVFYDNTDAMLADFTVTSSDDIKHLAPGGTYDPLAARAALLERDIITTLRLRLFREGYEQLLEFVGDRLNNALASQPTPTTPKEN